MSNFLSAAAKRAGTIVLFCGLFAFLAGRCGASAIIEFPIPTIGGDPEGITFGPDGAYWFVEFQAGRVGRIDATNGTVTEYPIPSGNCQPYGIVTGPDANLWFTEYKTGKVGRVVTIGTNGTNVSITEYSLPAGVMPTAITQGPDGRLWALDFGGQYTSGAPINGGILALTIDTFGTNGVTNTSYYNSANTPLTVHSRPASITSGPDGNLYFTEQLTGRIGRITTSGTITESALLPTNCQPFDIVTGPDGALWFTEAVANKLGRVDTSDTNLTNVIEYVLPVNSSGLTADNPGGLILGPDGNLWYTDSSAGFIARVKFGGTNFSFTSITNRTTNSDLTVTTNVINFFNNVTQYFTPTANSFPRRLATGADGNIWFGEFTFGGQLAAADNIARFTFPVPLSIQLTSNSQVVISWTTNVGGAFLLQSNADLTTTNWGFVTNVPVAVGNRFNVTNPATGNLFYRLID